MEDIRAVETSTFIMNVGLSELVYKDVLAGGMYSFTKQYANAQLYIAAYDKLQDMLAGKYGEPGR